jgi:ferredoxin/DMSO/TMAO reductase YedYZ heme-binding membrane subunit
MQFARRHAVAEEDHAVRSTADVVHQIAATIGFVSFFLLWLAVVWGMILRNGWAQTRLRHSTAYGVHMVMALLGLCLGTVHAFVQLANPTGTVYLVHVFVPFIHRYDPIGIGVGVISLELLIALTLSILIQRLLGYTRWRALHTFAYVAFMLLVAHVLISGTDTAPTPVWGAVFGAWLVTVVMWLTSTGLFSRARRKVRRAIIDRPRSQAFTVNVDAMRCGRFGFCEHEAPEVFRLRSDGRLSYRGSVPMDQLTNVMRAVEVCPARAIGLNQVPTKVFTPKADSGVHPVSGPAGLVDTGRHQFNGLRERPRDRRRPARRGGHR